MFLAQVTNMFGASFCHKQVCGAQHKYLFVVVDHFTGILQLQHLPSNSCGRAEGRDCPSGTCRWTSTKSVPQILFSVCSLLLWEGSVCLELALGCWNVRKEYEKGLGSFLLCCASLCELEVLGECKEQHCSGGKKKL